jgi:hypothetical protein
MTEPEDLKPEEIPLWSSYRLRDRIKKSFANLQRSEVLVNSSYDMIPRKMPLAADRSYPWNPPFLIYPTCRVHGIRMHMAKIQVTLS